MKFLSIREYFYRLSNKAILLVTFAVASIGVAEFLRDLQPMVEGDAVMVVFGVITALAFAELTLVNMWYIPQRIRLIRQEFSLGLKLERYAQPVVLRLLMCVSAVVWYAVGYYFTGHLAFVLLPAGVLLLFFFFWPTRERACRELQLKPDQRQMVLHDLDLR